MRRRLLKYVIEIELSRSSRALVRVWSVSKYFGRNSRSPPSFLDLDPGPAWSISFSRYSHDVYKHVSTAYAVRQNRMRMSTSRPIPQQESPNGPHQLTTSPRVPDPDRLHKKTRCEDCADEECSEQATPGQQSVAHLRHDIVSLELRKTTHDLEIRYLPNLR